MTEVSTISIVLPAFGPNRVIARAIDAIERQTAANLELIVVHDRAEGPSARRRLAALAARMPTSFVVARGPGPGARRNAGVRESRGHYFSVVDGAEALEATHLERARTALDAAPLCGFATTLGAFTEATARPEADIDLSHLLSSPWAVGGAILVRRRSFDRSGGFDESLPDLVDWDLLLTLAEAGEAGALIQGGGSSRYVHDDVRLREALRAERHLPAVRRIFAKHTSSFERHAPRVLSDREAIARTLWRTRGLELADRRERLGTELAGVLSDLAQVRAELKQYGRATLEWNDLRRTTPLSRNWGLERGRPIDRHYIEGFLAEQASDVRGTVLEVLDPGLTAAYGGSRVHRSDVLDIDPGNHRATVIADLRAADQLPANTYDCFILTQTLHLIDEMQTAVAQAHRTLKPGGVLLATLPCLSMVAEEYGSAGDHWRVTEAGARQLFERVFAPAEVQTCARGNVLAATAFLYGLSCDELEPDELEANDAAYPLIVTVRAVKAASAPAVLSSTSHRPGALILLYHQVSSRPHDVHGMAVEPEVFRSHLDHLCRQWRPVSLAALAEATATGEPPEGAVALTFDDGYVDNLEHAARLLAEFEVPATFFLTSERLDRHRRFWWDSLEQILLAGDRLPETITLRIDGRQETFVTAGPPERRAVHERLYPIFKASLPAVRDDLLRQLSMAVGVGRESNIDRPMVAEEMRALAGFPLVDLGAHGVHHIALAGLPTDQLHREVFESRAELQRVTGRSIDLFAYPFGDVSPESVEMVRAADFRFAVGCDPRCLRPIEHPYRLPRLEPPHTGGEAFADWLSRTVSFAARPLNGR